MHALPNLEKGLDRKKIAMAKERQFANVIIVQHLDIARQCDCSYTDQKCNYNVFKRPWNTHAVAGIFYPCPFFAAKIVIASPLPPLYNVESIAEALSYLERHHFSLQCYLYHLETTVFYGGEDFVVRLHHKSQEVFQEFWQTSYILFLLYASSQMKVGLFQVMKELQRLVCYS